MKKFKMPKKDFIRNVIGKFGIENMSEDVFEEMTEESKINRTFLYYKNDKHIASWSGGEGWFV